MIKRIILSVTIARVILDTVRDLRNEYDRKFGANGKFQRKVTEWSHLYSWLTSRRRFVTF